MSATPPAPPDFPTSPYAPPSVDAPPPAPPLARGVGPTDWLITDAVAFPFRAFSWSPAATLLPLALWTIVVGGLMFAMQLGMEWLSPSDVSDFQARLDQVNASVDASERMAAVFGPHPLQQLATTAVLWLAQTAVQAWLMLGIYRFCLLFARGEHPTVGTLFAFGPGLGAALLAVLLSTFLCTLGFFALIVPGIILSLGWALVLPVIADGETSPLRALGESWRLMRGSKGRLFLAAFLGALISFAVLCTCVGVLWLMPGFALGGTYVYLRLRGERPAFPPRPA